MEGGVDLFSPEVSSRELARRGMIEAAEHADAVEERWMDRAYVFFLSYAESHSHFMSEDVRVDAYRAGLPKPPDGRAWGHVAVRAQKEKIIVVDHYSNTKVKPAHATPRAVYRSLILKGVTTYA